MSKKRKPLDIPKGMAYQPHVYIADLPGQRAPYRVRAQRENDIDVYEEMRMVFCEDPHPHPRATMALEEYHAKASLAGLYYSPSTHTMNEAGPLEGLNMKEYGTGAFVVCFCADSMEPMRHTSVVARRMEWIRTHPLREREGHAHS